MVTWFCYISVLKYFGFHISDRISPRGHPCTFGCCFITMECIFCTHPPGRHVFAMDDHRDCPHRRWSRFNRRLWCGPGAHTFTRRPPGPVSTSNFHPVLLTPWIYTFNLPRYCAHILFNNNLRPTLKAPDTYRRIFVSQTASPPPSNPRIINSHHTNKHNYRFQQ